jgi:hypothetical protein
MLWGLELIGGEKFCYAGGQRSPRKLFSGDHWTTIQTAMFIHVNRSHPIDVIILLRPSLPKSKMPMPLSVVYPSRDYHITRSRI